MYDSGPSFTDDSLTVSWTDEDLPTDEEGPFLVIQNNSIGTEVWLGQKSLAKLFRRGPSAHHRIAGYGEATLNEQDLKALRSAINDSLDQVI